MKTAALIHEPARVVCAGRHFVLVSPYRELPGQVGETRSEGPFYDSVPPDETHVYLPDARFLLGQTEEPSVMHPIER